MVKRKPPIDENVYCLDSRRCFAKRKHHMYPDLNVCTLLNSNYPDGKCPFCKPEREVTNGVYYPYIRPDSTSKKVG